MGQPLSPIEPEPAGPVRPRLQGGTIPLLPRSLTVALVVGFLAFVAGVQLAPARGAPQVEVPPPTASAAAPSGQAAATAAASGRSRFAAIFDAFSLLTEAGLPCPGSSSGGYGNGRAYEISWHECGPATPTPEAQLIDLEQRISASIRDRAVLRDGGVRGLTKSGGPTVISWNYSSDGLEGTIYLVATHTASNLQVVVVLTEAIPPDVR